jgi:hypothetical protein
MRRTFVIFDFHLEQNYTTSESVQYNVTLYLRGGGHVRKQQFK